MTDKYKELISRYGVGPLLSRAVLIVDDDAENLVVLGAVLEGAYRVHAASSGAQALEVIGRHEVDVVLTDQRMPGMTGIELLERLRTIRPDVAGILLTGYTDTRALVGAINDAQAFRYLRKPFEAEEVEQAIAEASEQVYRGRAIERLVELLSRRTEELDTALGHLRQAQQQMLHLERLSSMGRFAAGVTHDLRNAMVGLVCLEEEFQERGVEEELVETVKVGLSGVRNLLGTLETLHTFVRSHRLNMEMHALAPADVVRDAMTVMRMDMLYRERSTEVRVARELPQIYGDRQKLVQVLVNLIRNAAQATREKQRIVVEASTSTTGEVVFAVEDEGVGVAPEMRTLLFEPFVSGKGEQGLGMGLYMARLIAESHQGRMVCATGTDGRTRFELRVPGAPAPTSPFFGAVGARS